MDGISIYQRGGKRQISIPALAFLGVRNCTSNVQIILGQQRSIDLNICVCFDALYWLVNASL